MYESEIFTFGTETDHELLELLIGEPVEYKEILDVYRCDDFPPMKYYLAVTEKWVYDVMISHEFDISRIYERYTRSLFPRRRLQQIIDSGNNSVKLPSEEGKRSKHKTTAHADKKQESQPTLF